MPFTVVPNASATSGGIATAATNWTCRYQSTTMTSPSPRDDDRAVRGEPYDIVLTFATRRGLDTVSSRPVNDEGSGG